MLKFNIQIKNNNFGYFVIIQKFDQRVTFDYNTHIVTLLLFSIAHCEILKNI